GVDDAKLFLDPPILKVTLKAGAWVDPSKMMQAIRDAGFTPVPDEIHLTITGTLQHRDDRSVLVLSDMTTSREVACVAAPGNDALSRTLAERRERAVEIKGRWRFEGSGLLEVESISDR